MTVIVPKPAATFIHIPKTGGVSISRWLTANANGSYLLEKSHGGKHADQKRIARYLKQKDVDMGYTFCVVRNPWDRLVSAYHYYRRLKKMDVSFERFIHGEWKSSNKSNQWGCAEKQMHSYFYDIDCVLRFESLNDDFKTIQQLFKCNKQLAKHNKSNHNDFREYYTPELVDIVATRHAKDIAMFDYSFE